MERRNFITLAGMTTAAVCLAELAACTKTSGPSPSNGQATVDLNSQLQSVGSSVQVNDIIVVRTASGNTASSFVAVSDICTHQGCTVGYSSSQNIYICPCHGSEYKVDGTVIQGPALKPLTRYQVTVNGSTLTVG